MGSRRLENAAAAAGYAMVNPEDFAREAVPHVRQDEPSTQQPASRPTAKNWFFWDYLRLTGGKATA